MSDDLVKRIKDRGDWLVDAVATATQNRQFLRGEPECDAVACDAIRMNGEKAMEIVAKPLADRIEELEAKLAKAVEALELYSCEDGCNDCPEHERDRVGCGWTARATLAAIKTVDLGVW